MKHAKRDFRDFFYRHAVGFGVLAGTLIAAGVLSMLFSVKV